jgi:hypothetical protein
VGLAVIPDSYSLHKEITNISWNTKKFGLKYEQEPKLLETRIIALGALLNFGTRAVSKCASLAQRF